MATGAVAGTATNSNSKFASAAPVVKAAPPAPPSWTAFDLQPVPNDPTATIAKMNAIRRSILASLRPSTQDFQTLQRANQVLAEAQSALNAARSPAPGDTASGDKNRETGLRRTAQALAVRATKAILLQAQEDAWGPGSGAFLQAAK